MQPPRGRKKMRNSVELTDDQIEALFDELGICLCVEDLTFTAETIDDFKASRGKYAERGQVDYDEIIDGYHVFCVSKVQPAKGMKRTDLYVVDFGDIRAAHNG